VIIFFDSDKTNMLFWGQWSKYEFEFSIETDDSYELPLLPR